MVHQHEALEVDDFYGVQDLDIGFGFGFDPWWPDMMPELDGGLPLPPAFEEANVPDEASRMDEVQERRRLRRKISNRESARRSRMRKQQRLEELQGTAARLREENRELAARLEAVAGRGHAVLLDNARLRAEAAELRRRLYHARRLVVLYRLCRLLPSPPHGGAGRAAQSGGGYASAVPVGMASLMT